MHPWNVLEGTKWVPSGTERVVRGTKWVPSGYGVGTKWFIQELNDANERLDQCKRTLEAARQETTRLQPIIVAVGTPEIMAAVLGVLYGLEHSSGEGEGQRARTPVRKVLEVLTSATHALLDTLGPFHQC